MGARVEDGKLSKAFALCEVDHEITRIRHYGNSQDHMSFISSSTIDHEAGRGEQWYTAVPWVRCANLLEAGPELTRADITKVGDQSGASQNGGKSNGGPVNSARSGATGSARRNLASTGDGMSSSSQAAALYAMGGLAGLAAGAALHAKKKGSS